MIENNNTLIRKFGDAFNDKRLLKSLLSNKVSYHITCSSLEALALVNDNIDVYLKNESKDNSIAVFNIFAMLQSLFVGIDALYSLSYGITNRKWSVNVNMNPNLREIKYIRNDVVGHPTKRTYDEDKIGYCDLNKQKTSYYNLVYKISIPSSNDVEEINYDVDLKRVINNYYLESDKLLKEIYNRMFLENPNANSYLSEMCYRLFKEYKKGIRNFELLDNIRKNYISLYKLEDYTSDRYIWRINIIEELFKWDQDAHSDVIAYMINMQIEKIFDMSLIVDQEKNDISFTNLNFKYKIPNSIQVFKAFVKQNNFKDAIYLNDNKYPLFDYLIRKIQTKGKKNKVVTKICDMFIKNKENSLRIYALGSSINYEKNIY